MGFLEKFRLQVVAGTSFSLKIEKFEEFWKNLNEFAFFTPVFTRFFTFFDSKLGNPECRQLL
jgi:hypothetical protein